MYSSAVVSRSAILALSVWLSLHALPGAAQSLADPPVLGQAATQAVSIDPSDPIRLRWRGQEWLPAGLYGGAIHQTSATWANPRAGYLNLLDQLASHGLNYSRAWIHWGIRAANASPQSWDYRQVHPYLRVESRGAPRAYDGGAVFDLDRINPEWLDLIEESVDAADARNVALQLVLFDCWHVKNNIASDYYHGSNNTGQLSVATAAEWIAGTPGTAVSGYQTALVNAVLDRIGDRPNVVYEVCNEKPPGGNLDHLVGSLVKARTGRLVVPLDLPEHRDVAGHDAPGTSNNTFAKLVQMRQALIAATAQDKPLISDNDCCTLPFVGSAFVRQKAWAVLTAGAQMNFFQDNIDIDLATQGNADFQLGMRQLAFVPKVLKDLGVRTAGMRAMDAFTPQTDDWVYGRSGSEYLVYLPNGGSVTLPAVSSRNATWINPRQLSTAAAPANATVYSQPTGADWALLVRDGAAIDHRLLVSYRPSAGGARQEAVFSSPNPAPVHFHYDEAAGNFEQRSGGACHDGYANPDYVEVRYAGQGFSSCSLRSVRNPAGTQCSAALVAALNAGQGIVLSTDEYAISPQSCLRSTPLAPNVLHGQVHWWDLELTGNGQTQTRRISLVKDTTPAPYLLFIGDYTSNSSGAAAQVISSVASLAPVDYHYNPALGGFEQRPGGRCANGSNNPSYFRVRYHGDIFDSCTVQTSLDPDGTPAFDCSAQLRSDLLAGASIVINTEAFEAVANGACPPQFTTQPRAPVGSEDWIQLNLSRSGVVYPRRIALHRVP